MRQSLPIVYVVESAVAVTGAFVAARQAAILLKGRMRVVLVLPRGSRIPAEALSDFWRVDYLSLIGLSKNMRALVLYVPALFVDAWRIKRRMKIDGAIRLWLNDFYLMQGAVMRLLGFRGHIVSWVRCDPAVLAGPLARPLLWLAMRSVDKMVAVSAFVQTRLPPHILAERIYDCYVGQERMPKTWSQTDEKIFVYMGNYIAGKGQDMALAAFAIAAAADPTICLAFYGGDMGLPKNRAYRAALMQKAQQLGIDARVTFHDFVVDVSPVLTTAYAALNFSTNESFSMTVLEACGAGVPVIATRSGGPQEIIVDAVTGHLISVGDVAAAGASILALAQNPVIACAMGVAAAAHVRKNFSPQNFCREICAVLDVANGDRL